MKSKEGVLLIGVINNIILLYGKEIYNKGEKMLGEKGREERYHSGGWMTEGVEINEGVLIKIIIIVLAYKIIWGIVGESRKGISERILMGINMIGAIVIIGGVSKEIMILYLGLEIYSFTTYILLTTPMGGGGMETRKMSIQYLFYNSFSSALLLIAIYLRYNEMGGLTPLGLSEPEGWGITRYGEVLYMIAITFKLGGIPYSYWIMRVYPAIEKGILLIQLIVSKYIYIILLIRLEEIINPGWGKGVYKNTIMIIGLMTLIYGTYKGVMQKTYKGIIASSSILTLGIILISIRYGLRDEIKGEKVTVLLEKYKELGEMPWEINHAMFIYIINILLLFGIYYGKEKGKSNMGWIAIIGILSMIGVPPLGGFYSKLYLLSPLITRAVDIGLDPDGQLFRTTPEVSKGSEVKKISDISENPIETGLGYNEIWGGRLGLIIIILTSILSFYYYFKILIKGGIIEIKNKAKGKREEEESKQEGNGGMLKGVLTIIILFYGYILPFIFPFF